ncbi:hypothetical protein MTBBW1_1290026 [Desulfamplus magnetovallimortis]|uniref:Uncharacterized protein n=1 Tax=Desulfamplus magnetovallimortis TaxID=1246637 RepID=A0A1W1H777_9BACT|nr:hypothetical protein [Desulfamplus magnetovallimortis]SLM28245.1 hypothetical protein MTBBW1_1290026 [Desulfamplus magnetovallimortis]
MIDKSAQQNRNRVKKHLEQKINDGYKRISCFISGAAYQQLQTLKQESKQATGALIESLIMNNDIPLPCTVNSGKPDAMQENENIPQNTPLEFNEPELNINTKVHIDKPEKQQIKHSETDGSLFPDESNNDLHSQLQQIINSLTGDQKGNIDIETRDKVMFLVHDLYPGRSGSKMRIAFMNDNGILYNGRKWKTKDFSDQIVRGRERMNKK